MATLAIAGAPGLLRLLQQGRNPAGRAHGAVRQPGALWLGVLTAGLTSFYMFRLLFLTFHGAPRYDEHHVHVHESPENMLVPLVVLAILSVGGGWLAAPHLLGGVNHFEHFLAPVFGTRGEAAAARPRIPARAQLAARPCSARP